MGTVSQQSWQTTDMSTAAFVKMRGLPLENVANVKGHFTFFFQDVEGRGDKLRLEFVNGEFSDYDDEVRKLKKMCYDRPHTVSRRR